MKNILKLLSLSIVLSMFHSCKDSNNAIDDVLNYQTGVALRTIEVLNSSFNSSDPNSTFAVTVEEQDAQQGGLFEAINVYARFQDLTPDNGTVTVPRGLATTISADTFEDGPFGLPRGTVSVTFAEATSAMGLSPDDYFPGDLYIIELEVVLTDGRTFGPESAGSSITGGFFDSPFAYNALLTCTPEPGVYTIDMFDSYGDGWQTNDGSGGDGITVVIEDENGDTTTIEFGMCSPYGGAAGSFLEDGAGTGCTGPASTSFFEATTTIEIPEGTVAASWNYPGDNYGEIAFDVYAPNGELIYSAGTGEATAGVLPITFCLQD